MSKIVRSRAPLRLGLAGGGTDVSPYSDLYGGNVLNAAIDMYAYCTIIAGHNGDIEFHAADLGESWVSPAKQDFALDGPLMLHKAIYNRIVSEFNGGEPLSVRVITNADAPPGSGLGTSSTMVVAILRAYQELLKLPLGEYDLAQLAYDIERKDCGLAGGKQDQYVATFGGFNFMEFYADDRVIVNPLRIRDEIINEIECSMLLYFTGRSRESANIIKDQIHSAESGDGKSLQAMHRVRQSAVEMKEALLKAEIKGMAGLLGESWKAKRDMAQSISNSLIDQLFEKALEAGALSAKISGAVSITAEVDYSRIVTRHEQGWVDVVSDNLEEVCETAQKAVRAKENTSIAFHGNVVDLIEYLGEKKIKVDLLSDQTSCHVVYDGGYCPQGISFEERTRLLAEDRDVFISLVNKSLKRHLEAVKVLDKQGTFFFDYGNAFLKAVFDAGVTEIAKNGVDTKDGFVYPSYFEDIMGPIFDYGYGPFRWVCLSCDPVDLDRTDKAAMSCIDPGRRTEDRDNYIWIRDAKKNKMVIGSQARILYADANGRRSIALKFNEMVRNGEVGPVMLGRDHHDPGGTDSPFRETANVKDGSNVCADMATHCFAGNAARGMSLVALHNGGGTGIGKAINGGFGMVLDGSSRVDEILKSAMTWDVMGGVARRNWSRNPNAMEVAMEYNRENDNGDQITIPYQVVDSAVDDAVKEMFYYWSMRNPIKNK